MEKLYNQELKNLLMLSYYQSYQFLKKSMKAKIKQLTTKKILQERPFYKQSITKPRIKKIKQPRIITSFHFMMILIFHKMKGHLEGMLKPIK